MTLMERFHSILNRSQQPSHKDVESYRNNVDTTLRSILRQRDSNQQALVIGTGNATDFSLSLFLEFMDQVILTDIDADALASVAGQRRNVHTVRVDYTGMEDLGFFESFARRLWQCHSTDDIDRYLDDVMKSQRAHRYLMEYAGTNDLVFVSPIYTQLIYQQVLHELSGLRADGYALELAERCQERMLEEMTGIIERFNNNLISLLKEDGILVVLSDVFELRHDSEFYRKVAFSIKQKDVMDEIYETYRNTYGFGLGDYGPYDLSNKIQRTKSRWLLWRFDHTRSFAVYLNIYQHPTSKGGTT